MVAGSRAGIEALLRRATVCTKAVPARNTNLFAIFIRRRDADARKTDLVTPAICVGCTLLFARPRLVRQPQRGQRNPHDADAEFLQRTAARDGLRQAFGQVIEFVVHNFPFVLVCFLGNR